MMLGDSPICSNDLELAQLSHGIKPLRIDPAREGFTGQGSIVSWRSEAASTILDLWV